MSEREVGYAVVVWNQSSGRPDLVDGSFTDARGWADEIANGERARTAEFGRGETYSVVQLIEIEEDRR